MPAPYPLRATGFSGEVDRLVQYLQRWADRLQSRALLSLETRAVSANTAALPGELVIVDTMAAARRVALPKAGPGNAGQMIAVANRGTNTLTVVPESGTVAARAASTTVGSNATTLFLSDGLSNWSAH